MKVRIYIKGIVDKWIEYEEAADWVFSDCNTEEHPLHIYDEDGNEIEW